MEAPQQTHIWGQAGSLQDSQNTSLWVSRVEKGGFKKDVLGGGCLDRQNRNEGSKTGRRYQEPEWGYKKRNHSTKKRMRVHSTKPHFTKPPVCFPSRVITPDYLRPEGRSPTLGTLSRALRENLGPLTGTTHRSQIAETKGWIPRPPSGFKPLDSKLGTAPRVSTLRPLLTRTCFFCQLRTRLICNSGAKATLLRVTCTAVRLTVYEAMKPFPLPDPLHWLTWGGKWVSFL